MTKVLDLLKAMLASPWLPLAGTVTLALLLVRDCNRASRAETKAVRLAEAARLREQHLLVLEQDRAAVEALAKELTGANVFLRAERDRALAAARKARLVLAAALRTGPLVVSGTPRPPEPPSPGALPIPCLLAPGDTGEIRVDELQLETGAGNRVVVGTAEAWRLSPAPSSRLFGGPFRADLSQVAAEPPPRAPGWGGGVMASVGGGQAAAGPALAFPPWRLLGLQLEAAVGATILCEQRLHFQMVVRP